MGHGWTVLAATAAVLALAPPAFAGTVSVDGSTARFDAAPGDRDRIEVTSGAWGVSFDDFDGNAVTPGPGCAPSGRGAVCPPVTDVVVALGDGDDEGEISFYNSIPVRLEGGPGNDILDDGTGADVLDGGDGDDWFVEDGTDGRDADVLFGGPGEDRALYTQRFNSLNISLDDVPNDGEAGEHDNVHSDVEMVDGGSEDDTLTGSAGDDELNGGGGDDTLYGLGGDDLLDGFGTCGKEKLYGGDGDDTLRLEGQTYADGGAGDDTFKRGGNDCTATDTAVGGPGIDTADFSNGHVDGSVSLDDVANDGEDGVDNYHSDIENLIGDSDGMTLIGSDGPNVITGGEGDDALVGGGGPDTLSGGGGYDVADYSDHSAPVSLTLDGVANDGAHGENDQIASDVEDLRGGAGADTLVGDDGDNALDGGPGADVLRGGAGIDSVDYSLRSGAVQADLDGAVGDDGEAGEGDTIGADVEGLFGGDGADALTGNAADGFLDGGPGNDHLVDPGGMDYLDAGSGDDGVEAIDGAVDEIHCGAGADRLWADAGDQPALDCEARVIGPQPASPPASVLHLPGPVTFTRPRVVRGDRTAPKLGLRVSAHPSARGVRAHGLRITVSCDEPCAVTAKLRASPATAKALRRRGIHAAGLLARGTLATPAMGARTMRVAVNAVGRRALHGLRAGAFILTVQVTDPSGNARDVSKTLRFAR